VTQEGARRERQTASLDRGVGRFGRDRRLRSARDFARVRQEGRTVAANCLALGYARSPRLDGPSGPQPALPARVGFAVSKRVGGAVVRNRVKRRLRETVRRRLWALASGWDLVIIARPPAATATSAALAGELEHLLARSKVLASGSEESTV
jgi:ribonuclease P protein component